MTMYRTTFGSMTHRFDDLKTVLAKASPRRSGDELAGLAAANDEEPMAARFVLADVRLSGVELKDERDLPAQSKTIERA